jgi:hypothetical protein
LFSCLLFKTIKIRKYKTVILPVVLYGCVTWSLALKEEHGLTVFGSKVVRDEVTLSCRKLHNGEVHNLNSSSSIIRMVKLRRGEIGRACNTNGVERNVYGYWWES